MATDAELLQRVYSFIGSELDTGIARPLILAMATLAYRDLAIALIDSDSELVKKLITTVSNQLWSNNSFTAPSDMIFHKNKSVITLDFGGVLAHQIEDNSRLSMISGLSNSYYALDGRTFFIKRSDGTTSGSNLNLRYYKIPTITDIDAELMPLLLNFLLARLSMSKTNTLKLEDMAPPPKK